MRPRRVRESRADPDWQPCAQGVGSPNLCNVNGNLGTLMAIKRTHKGRGTPARKSATTPPIRHVEILRVGELLPHHTYTGWLCKNRGCGRLIALTPASLAGTGSGAEFGDPLSAIRCPHCGEEDLYRFSARTDIVYTPAGAP